MNERILTGAADIGGTKIQVGIVDDTGKIYGEESFPTDCSGQSAEQAMGKIAEALQRLSGNMGVRLNELRGIGVFCAGPVDIAAGTIENPYTLAGWKGFPAAAYLSGKTGIEVKLENDANGALLGEVSQRKLYGRKVLMITFGTGIGVAFWDGKGLYRSGRYHPEMGHVIVSSKGAQCYCGHRGCFESRCSGRALNQRAADAGYGDFDELYRMAAAGEKAAEELLKEMLGDIGNGVWNLSVVFKPDSIILAGGFAANYFDMLEKAVCSDREGKSDFLEEFDVLSASGNRNSALNGVNILFGGNADEKI